jgi:hypothetical protein
MKGIEKNGHTGKQTMKEGKECIRKAETTRVKDVSFC